MKTQFIRMLTIASLSLGIVACGGDDDDNTKHAKGTLVEPIASQKVIAKVLAEANGAKFKDECPNVPAGYKPLQNIKVEFINKSGSSVSNTNTDKCGEFSANVPNEVVKVKAKSSGNKDLIADVSVFQEEGSKAIASTIPSNAEYQISSMQMIADNKLAFSVTDTVTNNAVIGIPSSALSLKVNSQDASISKVSTAASEALPASVTLVMDASPSMLDKVLDENQQVLTDDNGNFYNRFRIAALAAHTYLDNVSNKDETGLVIFDERVNFMNDASVKSIYPNLLDTSGNIQEYQFSESGYTSTASKLRFLVDLYNPFSELYSVYPFPSETYIGFEVGPAQIDKKHADSPLLTSNKQYPWQSGTAIFDGIEKGLSKTDERQNARKIVIAMSDGGDNRSLFTQSRVIESAKNKSIPVHTIFFSDRSNASEFTRAKEAMSSIAKETNASFLDVKGTNLVSAFRSIQTSITFQYLANLVEAVSSGNKVALTLHYNGETATREVTR